MVVNVEDGERRPARRACPAWLCLLERRVRLQGQLQVQDVVYDVLEDLHFADFLILRNGGHQALEAGVAVVHVVLQAEQVLLVRPAAPGDVDAVFRQGVHGGRMARSASVAAR